MSNQDIQVQVLDFLVQAGDYISKLETEKKALASQVETLTTERLILEKVAAQRNAASVFDGSKLSACLRQLQNACIISKDSDLTKAAASINSNPAIVLELINATLDRFDKIASVHSQGMLVDPLTTITGASTARNDKELEAELWHKMAMQGT